MFRAVSAFISIGLGLVASAVAQQPQPAAAPPVSKADRAAAAAVQPPLPLPAASPAPATFVAPPLPGQLKAVPALASPLAPALPPAIGPAPANAPSTPPLPQISAPNAAPLKGLPPLPENNTAANNKGDLKPVPPVALNRGGTKPVSSTSSSGQFIVHGDDLPLRSAFSRRCDDISENLRQLLRDQQPWVLPIVVLLKTGEGAKSPGKAVSYTISQIPNGGFHLQVNVNVRGDLRPADLRADVIRILLAERILRNQTDLASKRPRLLPDWVFTGVLEAMDYRQRARPSALFGAIFKSGKIYSIEEIIEASPVAMDALSKTIYQTSCCALVMALLDQPEGGLRLGKFLNSLASDARPERDLLNQWFPNFATTPASLNKWWSLQLASLANPSVAEPLSPTETMKQLEAALMLRFKAKPSELPKPRPVVATVSKPAPEEVDKPATKTAEPTVPSADEPNKKPSLFARLNPFAKRAQMDEKVIAAAMKEAALAEAKSSESPPPTVEAATVTQVAGAPPATAPEEDAAAAKKPFMGWLFGSGDKKKAEEKKLADDKAKLVAEKPAAEDKASPAAEVKAVEAKKRPTAEKNAPEPNKAKVAEAKTVPEPKAKTEPEKKANSKPEQPKISDQKDAEQPEASPEVAGEKKPSNLNPLRWFRGNKKDKPKDKESGGEETPPAKKSAQNSLSPTVAQALWAWSPLAGDSLIFMQAQSAASPSREVEGFLGLKFGKKKAADGEEAAPKEPSDNKKADKKEEKKPEPKVAKEKSTPTAPAPAPAPAPEPAPAKADEPKREPIKIKPLFGSGKKDKDESVPAADMPKEEPPAPAPSVEKEKPKAKKETRPPEPSSKAAKKTAEDEPFVDAAIPIEDYAAVMKRKDRTDILKQSSHALVSLQTRSSVLFRPIIAEYNEILVGLMDGKTKGVDERLRSLRTRAAAALKKSKAVRDFIDVYEANESPAFSGLFDDYLKLPETISEELPERSDAMSKYLDALDKEFSGR